ncbi:MAG: nucleotidyltransferase domain-containing protein [Faecalicatena sp.]|uniref:nucleotidyltransferase domain-containing protein n=1 Tax=Faecalicatena sp. TaxID=2005360 RepID=UPI00258C0F85|nr:nucleotidyltransferase domain-containing protein [Faecalicatena sp.]MCI6464214.1 nucleotidyltransferase domain-containing protein [Faecalicatena sp.]MDY5621180.1 nucleotidyltransferase domain-containing protein [Lachnospiraceae bacterium]
MVNSEIEQICNRLQAVIMPKQIYLFGSFAKDEQTKDSDYDFYLVVSDDAGDQITIIQKAYKSLRGIRKRPVDILVGYETAFQRRSREETLEKTVKKEGILLYEQQRVCS